jgi:glycosyltransferase involved in cell wall biosynthesis
MRSSSTDNRTGDLGVKIVQISGFDTLGIQVNGYLLHRRLEERGHDSHMFVHAKYSDDPKVEPLFNAILSRLNGLMVRLQLILSLWSVLPAEGFSILGKRPFWRADIVHIQLMHNAQFFSLVLVALLSWLKPKGRVVLSIHDMFMVTGHCLYSLDCERWKTGCGKCPDLAIPFVIRRDATRFNWWFKRLVFRLARIHLVVGSPWQARMIEQSPILRKLPVHYIPYGIDTRIYRPRDKAAARRRFGIPLDAHVIAFRHVPYSRNFKGGAYIIDALAQYEPRRETYLLTIEGVGGLDAVSDKYKIVQNAWTNDDQELIADFLTAADVFLMPSIAEAFGLMAAEALACQTPVVVFEGTALPETINAPQFGLAVPMKDAAALAGAIAELLGDEERRLRMGHLGADFVSRKHNFEDYVEKHLALYRSILLTEGQQKGTDRGVQT